MSQIILDLQSLDFVDPSYSMQIAFFDLGGCMTFSVFVMRLPMISFRDYRHGTELIIFYLNT